MTEPLAVTVMVAIAVLLLAAIAWGWRARTRRDRGYAVPRGEAPADAVVRAEFATLYVATTRHDEPLERLALPGLAFRSRAALTVFDQGVAIDLTGQSRIFLSRDRISAVRQAQVAIDRVVEKDGLIRIDWLTDSGDTVDSYFRPQDVSPRTVNDAVATMLALTVPPSETTPTGLDA